MDNEKKVVTWFVTNRAVAGFSLALLILALIGWYSYRSVGGSLLALALVALAIWVVNRDFVHRKEVEQQLRRHADELESRVQERTAELTEAYQALQAEIEQRQRTAEALRASESKLSGIIASAMDAIITIDSTHHVTLFNAAAEKMFGVPVSEAIGQPLDRFIPARFRDAHRQHVDRFGRTNVSKRQMGALGAIFGLRADGTEFPIEASISQLDFAGQKYYTVILRDITLRQQVEEQLREQAALLDQARDAIIVRDLEDQVRYWNKSAERVYGWTAAEVLGRSVRSLMYQKSDAEFERAKRATLEKGEWAGELRQQNSDGKELIVESRWTLVRDATGRPKSIFAINTDISDKKKLEAQFLRAQRMESIGTLASGIAHDLNNILSPLLTGLQLLQLKITDPESRRWLEMLRANAERGGEMVQQVLSFARGMGGERVRLQPKHVIKDVVKMLRETLPKSITIRSEIPNDLDLIVGDATQLHQVLMNLAVNARDAMPNGGLLEIKAENVTVDQTYAHLQLDARPARYLCISVTDTGEGIPPDIINRVFDPFFTTKPHGKGTGLGLSTVQAIVKGHGGFLSLYSEPGKGTQFKVYLPAAEGQAQPSVAPHPELPFGHGEWILVVDDEAMVREITKGTLENFGYRVLTASNGTEAVATFAEHRDKISLVLTDMMMPLMDGPALVRALHKLSPQLKIIGSSGLAGDQKMAEARQAGVQSFLPKPYSADKLLKAVAETLSTN